MLNYLKQWYEENFTDPNQVSLALIVIFSVLITYILVQTISPILVAIVLAYMLEGLVQNLMKTAHIVRNISVILVFFIFLILSVITLFMLIPLLLDQLTLFVKSLPEIFDKSKKVLILTDNVIYENKKDLLKIYTNRLTFNQLSQIISTQDETKIIQSDKYNITGKNFFYDKKNKII